MEKAARSLGGSAVKVIGSALVARRKGEQFLPDIWEMAFPSDTTKLARDFSVMLAARQWRSVLPFIHRLLIS